LFNKNSTADLGVKYNKDEIVTEIVEEIIIYFKREALSVYFTSIESTPFF